MNNITDVATQMNACKIMAIALPRFYKRTKLSAQISFSYNKQENGMQISLGFLPQEATKEQYSILFEELLDAEKLLTNEYIINNTSHFDTLKQFHFKHKEEMRQIIEKQKADL